MKYIAVFDQNFNKLNIIKSIIPQCDLQHAYILLIKNIKQKIQRFKALKLLINCHTSLSAHFSLRLLSI